MSEKKAPDDSKEQEATIDVFEFHERLRQHCLQRTPKHDPDLTKGCLKCCFRLYCWIGVCDTTPTLIRNVIKNFQNPIDRSDSIEEEFTEYLLSVRDVDMLQHKNKVVRALSHRDICIYDGDHPKSDSNT